MAFTGHQTQEMVIIKQSSHLRDFMLRQRAAGLITGFVPTMGALHAGHLELVKTAASLCNVTIVSIFINPTQFNDPGDFKKYPQTLDRDILLLEKSAASVLFIPDVENVYHSGLENLEKYNLDYLETILEGKYRPGHFQGVCQVMSRLLQLVDPDKLLMGQKDYQQCMVIKKLIEIAGLKTELITCPTVREADGLAMSSRNMRLPASDRSLAPLIYQVLQTAAENIVSGDLSFLRRQAVATLQESGFRPDYFEFAEAATLEPVKSWDRKQRLVILVAAFLGEIRLIDNLLVA